MPNHQVRPLGRGVVAGRLRRARAARRSGARARRRSGASTGAARRRLRHLGQLRHAEDEGIARVSPLRRAIAADAHLGRQRLVFRRVVGHAHRRALVESLVAHNAEEPFAILAIVFSLEQDERVAFLGPRHPLVERGIGFERGDDACLHVPNLDAVADLLCGVDHHREIAPALVEAEFGHVADVQLRSGLEIAEDQVTPARRRVAWRIRRGRRRAASSSRRSARGRRRPSRRRAVAVHGDPSAGFAREHHALDLRDRGLLAIRQVHQRDAVLIRPARARVRLRLAAHRRNRDRRPRRVRRERRGRPALAHGELPFLRAGRRTNHHVTIALERREPVGEPLAVRRQRRAGHRSESQDVVQGDRPLGRVLGVEFGRRSKRDQCGRQGQHDRETQALHGKYLQRRRAIRAGN